MGGVSNKEQAKQHFATNKMIDRPQKLKSAREGFEKQTKRKSKPVSRALMYKDFTALEKRQYAALEAEDKKKKTLLG